MMTATLKRLRMMSTDELAWRARTRARIDAQRLAWQMRRPRWDRRALRDALAAGILDRELHRAIDVGAWGPIQASLVDRLRARPSRFLLDHFSAPALTAAIRSRWPSAASDAAARADRIAAGRLDILAYQDLDVAAPNGEIDWHFDPHHRRRAPTIFCADVPFLDPSIGDHKVIWEINRHQDWLMLGRAWWLSDDPRYRDAIVGRLESWLGANPPLVGINWASMLEIGLRALSWTWALHFLLQRRGPEHPPEPPWLVDMLVGLDRQLTHVEQNLSHYFSPNTHLLGEALALYVVGLAIPELRASGRWIERGRQILLQEIGRQIHADGGHAEGSLHYHRYALDMYLNAWLSAAAAGDTETLPHFTDAVTRLATFARATADDSGLLALIGDDDGGTLWPILRRPCSDIRDSLAIAAVVLRRPELAPWGVPEEAFWIGGRLTIDGAPAIDSQKTQTAATSQTFHESGYVVLRDARGSHAIFDVGRHGYLNAGHAHADALSLTLTIDRRPLLVDPGTATYVIDRDLRDRLRGTRSHNTVAIDDRPQSVPGDPFQWRTRSDARLNAVRHNPAFDWAEASHDGYGNLRHRRTVLRTSSGWLVLDEVLGSGRHSADSFWHFDPSWVVTSDETVGRLRASHADGSIAWLLTDGGTIDLMFGDAVSGLGWYAPVYGALLPTSAACVHRTDLAPLAFTTWIGTAPQPPTFDRLDTRGDAIAARVRMPERTSTFLLQPEPRGSPHWRCAAAGGCETDARALHVAVIGDRVSECDVVDATYARVCASTALIVRADTPVADLHVAIEQGIVAVQSSEPPPGLRLEGDSLAAAKFVRLNGCTLARDDVSSRTVVIQREQWPNTGVPLAPVPAAERHVSNSEEQVCRSGQPKRPLPSSSSLSG